MIHRFAFANFQSFRERVEVNWLLDGKVPDAVWSTRSVAGERASTVMAAIGPNASGKTALLKPMLFLNWFARQSFAADPTAKLPFDPHFAAQDQPSEFELDMTVDGELWRYTLRCTALRVLEESLYVRRTRMGYVFIRQWDEANQSYRVKQQDFGFIASEARKVRQNASLLSTAAQYGVPLAQRLVQTNLMSNVDRWGRWGADDQLVHAAAYFADHQPAREHAVQLLKRWDFGLSDVELRELEADEPDGSKKKFWVPIGVHRVGDGTAVRLPFALESSGTQSAFVLLARLLPVLERGGLAVIDEFENDLHPHMLEPILSLFADSRTNPHGAQLLFTCHAMEVLNILHKSQVMLVEKDDNNESTAWRLDSVDGIRSDDNFYAKYMAGAYGAVPQL